VDLEKLKIDRTPGVQPRRRRRGGLGWLAFLAVCAGALWFFRAPLVATADRLRLLRVRALTVRSSSSLEVSAVSGTSANGYVVARHRAALSADTPGRIVEMNVEEGSVVRKGDVVARLYADEYEAGFRRCSADLAAGIKTAERTEAQEAAARVGLDELRARAAAAEANVAEARANVAHAELNLRRSEKLLAEGVVTQERVDDHRVAFEGSTARLRAAVASKAEADAAVSSGESDVAVATAAAAEARARIDVLVAERDQAKATLDKTEVRAPFDGVVVLKDAEVGEVVSPNSQGGSSRGSVATMVDFGSLEVQVELPETSLQAVELGARCNVYLDAFPERLYAGRVERIWPTANRQKATIEVRVAFEKTDELLRPEMGARVVFAPGEPAAQPEAAGERILVPTGCIVRIEGKTGVFVLERDVARFREVATGAESSGRLVVEAGLEPGERIVQAPPSRLDDGDRVRIEED